MWIFNKTMAVRRTFESVLSFYDEDYYYCCFKAAAAAAARMYAIFTISWLLSWISYCVQPKSRQWEFFNKLHTKIFMYILCIILHIYFTFFSFENKKQQQRNVSNEITENIALKLFLYCYLYLISTERHYSHF